MFPEFKSNRSTTLGVELELMLLDPSTLDLSSAAVEVQRWAKDAGLGERIKLEITQSMIEINSSVHAQAGTLREELRQLGRALDRAARTHGVLICGGGTHPFHRWQERTLSPTRRFHELGHQYGYLAKQFTVFGQHVHVGCRNGDDAIRALNALSLYVPHFVALSAASPFHRGVDTSFDSCRLNMIAAFPLAGRMPDIHDWAQFEQFYQRLRRQKVIGSIKDLYWDIRPKPEFGTIEVRVPDTPLEVGAAADLAAYIQVLVEWSRSQQPAAWLDDFVYRYNRFQAARFGFDGQMILGAEGERCSIRDHIASTAREVAAVAARLNCSASLERLVARANSGINDATWLRDQRAVDESLAHLMAGSAQRWTQSLGVQRTVRETAMEVPCTRPCLD